jgi:hypothetical protein
MKPPYEPTEEDMEEYSRSLELDEMDERDEICNRLAEEQEREFAREGLELLCPPPLPEGPECDDWEDDENFPD